MGEPTICPSKAVNKAQSRKPNRWRTLRRKRIEKTNEEMNTIAHGWRHRLRNNVETQRDAINECIWFIFGMLRRRIRCLNSRIRAPSLTGFQRHRIHATPCIKRTQGKQNTISSTKLVRRRTTNNTRPGSYQISNDLTTTQSYGTTKIMNETTQLDKNIFERKANTQIF